MCGRYDLSDSPAAIKARFQVADVPEFAPNSDVRPTQSAPVVRLARDGTREAVLLRWGLVPAWAPDLKFGARCINARTETVAAAPAFRAAFKARRCLVPISAFFEWSGPKGARSKWRLALADGPFGLAGLWEWWRDPADPQALAVETFTILTTAAGAQVAPLHDRMPVIVAPADYARWLDPAADAAALLRSPLGEALQITPA